MVNCKIETCKKQAYYNLLGEQAIACGKHREKDMINVVNKRCDTKNCMTQSSYGYMVNGKLKVTHCSKHASSDMENKKRNVKIKIVISQPHMVY
jgi:hypothetical protein